MASLATLVKRAKAGDDEATAALCEQLVGADSSVAKSAAEALGRVGTKRAYEALAKTALESADGGLRFTCLRALDRALKKSPDAVELLIAMCEDPRVDAESYPIILLSNIAWSDKQTVKEDPRVLKSLRRAIDATHVQAQQAAIGTLVKLDDKESLPRMVATLAQEKRGPELMRFVAEGILKLGGGAAELQALREAAKTWTRRESVVEDVIAKIAKRVER